MRTTFALDNDPAALAQTIAKARHRPLSHATPRQPQGLLQRVRQEAHCQRWVIAATVKALYIDRVEINISRALMALQIAKPSVVSKVERLAKRTGLSKTAVVERAVDRLLNETAQPSKQAARLTALLAQLDRIPDRSDASNPLEWDEHGLPK